ncbi:hypothetical protein [Methanoculleus thermophilus]|uniref:Uncharacterized protein n=1 Tax=Methanoculleus thermophilus TaxID=2200 RepID=A0A1G9AFB3_9EURY|nr:hypothetical protein [Methanoculleus thermophilus]SDK26062.1 hypothetical protein SAMN04488571_10628 [Methanoculleus thermophilus]
MIMLVRHELIIIFASFLIGSAAGWWIRMQWGDGFIAVAATLLGTVIGYGIIITLLRMVGHPVE